MRIKITDKNAASVMGKINSFLKHGVSELRTMKLDIIENDEEFLAHEQELISNETDEFIRRMHRDRVQYYKERLDEFFSNNIVINRNKTKNKITFIRPLNTAYCEWHYILRARRNGDRTYISDDRDIPLLAICQEKAENCLPIYRGDIVEFKGSHLNVKSRYGRNRVRLNGSTTTYVITPRSQEAQVIIDKKYLRNLVISNILDECEMYQDISDYDTSHYRMCNCFRGSLINVRKFIDDETLQVYDIDNESDNDIRSVIIKFHYDENGLNIMYSTCSSTGDVKQMDNFPHLINSLSMDEYLEHEHLDDCPFLYDLYE